MARVLTWIDIWLAHWYTIVPSSIIIKVCRNFKGEIAENQIFIRMPFFQTLKFIGFFIDQPNAYSWI